MKDYTDLVAWQRAMDLVEAVYDLTGRFPRHELYGLTSQARRAAVSVAANIAEGQGRRTSKEFVHALSVAHGSLRELETLLRVAERLRYIDAGVCDRLLGEASETGKVLVGLMKAIAGPAGL